MRLGPRRGLLVALVVASVAAACTTSEAPLGVAAPEQAVTTTTAPVGAPGASTTTSSPPATTSSPPATTSTTTTLPLPIRLEIEVVPDTATVTSVDGAGIERSGMGAIAGDFVPPVRVVAVAEGFAPLERSIAPDEGAAITLHLDRPGQLLHKLAEFSSGPAPKQVAFRPGSSELWVTLLAGSGFEVFDATTGALLEQVELPEAGSVEVIFNQAGDRAYISQMETASVYEVDAETKEVVRRLGTEGVWTKVMVLSPDEQTLWASNWVSNDVSEIDLATGEVVRRLKTVTTPRGLAVTPDGDRLYVAGFEDGEIQVFDLATGEGEVIYRSGGAMRHLVIDPEGDLLYASDMARASVLVVDLATDDVRLLAEVDRVPNTIDLSPDGRVLYVSNRGRNNPETYYKPGPEWGTVVVIDTATGDYLDAIVGGNQTTGLDVSPDGSFLAFSDFLDDRVTVYEIPPFEVLAAGHGGRWEAHLAELRK